MADLDNRWAYNADFFEERWEYDKDIKINVLEYKTRYVPAHWHSEIEIMMVTKGTVTVGCNSEIKTLKSGDCIIIPGGNIHYSTNENYAGEALILLFAPTIFDFKAEELGGYSLPAIMRNVDIEYFKNIYDNILLEIRNGNTAFKLIIKAYLSLLSGFIIRNRSEDNIISPRKQLKSRSLINSRKLFQYIEENYNKKITLDMAADILHFHKGYFCRYFKELTGTTLIKYINTLRVQAAKSMLSNTDEKISDIASKCGFDNVRTFTREFKLHTGMTANRYRLLSDGGDYTQAKQSHSLPEI